MSDASIERQHRYMTDANTHDASPRLAPGMHNADAVAARLSMTRRRVYVLAAGGALPCVRMGGQIRFNGEAIEAWIAAGGAGYPQK